MGLCRRDAQAIRALAASTRPTLEVAQESSANLLRIVFSEKNASARGPAIFIDRDGVINQCRAGDYVLDWSQFVFMPGIREALKQLTTLRLPMIVISNQAAVGKGLLDRVGLEEITSKMYDALAADGTFLAAAYYCPHRPDEDCPCRKPKPALLLNAADDFNIDLRRSIFIGDSDTDVQAARAACCASVLFTSNIGPQPISSTVLPTAHCVKDLFSLVASYVQSTQRTESGC